MINVIVGAPCSGKTTYVNEHKSDGDIVIDFDAIASALGAKDHEADGEIFNVAVSARKAAIETAKDISGTAWVIDTEHKEEFTEDENVIVLDPGYDVCMERAKEDNRPQRTFDGIEKWYSNRKRRDMETLYKSFELKADEDTGKISGYFATYDRIPDSYGDVIAPGAFTETIKAREESGHPFPLCWNHDLDQIIGKVDSVEDTEIGPLMTASFFDTPLAQEKRALVKSGVVFQFSFAYAVKDMGDVEIEGYGKAYELRDLDLFEVSIVPIPANPRAEMTEIKGNDEVETKSGRRNSKKDADAIREAISILQGVLGEMDDIENESENEEDKAKANAAAEEPAQSNSRKDALLNVIAKIREESEV